MLDTRRQVHLHIDGYVQAKARPRFNTRNGKVQSYTPTTTARAEYFIAAAWRKTGQGQFTGPISLNIIVHLTRPQGHYGKRGLRPTAPMWPTTRPDLDNYVKTVSDALNGVAFTDDAHIVGLVAVKQYGESEGWDISIGAEEREG